MDYRLEIALFLIGQVIAIAIASVVAYNKLRDRLEDKLETMKDEAAREVRLASERIVRLETAFEMMGRRAIKAMHSPDDHLRLDALADKYINNNYDLPPEDWLTIHDKCEDIINKKVPGSTEDLGLAAISLGFSTHKLMAYGGVEAFRELLQERKAKQKL